MDEAGAYYTEWSKSEKERQILYINAYIYMEFRKMVLMNLFVGQNRDADKEKGLVGTAGEGEGGAN